jgi:hypothetical protein
MLDVGEAAADVGRKFSDDSVLQRLMRSLARSDAGDPKRDPARSDQARAIDHLRTLWGCADLLKMNGFLRGVWDRMQSKMVKS